MQEEHQQDLKEARKQQEEQVEYANKLKKVCLPFISTQLQSFARFLSLHASRMFRDRNYYLVPIFRYPIWFHCLEHFTKWIIQIFDVPMQDLTVSHSFVYVHDDYL